MEIKDVLQCGAENALSTAELLSLTGHANVRRLQAQIADERNRGALILSSAKGGYYLPSDDPEQAKTEIAAYIRTLRGRALSTLKVLKAANRAIKSVDEQTALPGW